MNKLADSSMTGNSTKRDILVSVIIPIYGHRDHLLQSVFSALEQTETDIEIIVVNDSSPDDSETLLQPLIDSKAIRYFKQTNAGPAAARNNGLTHATGRWIAFLDDDDCWPRDRLEIALRHAQRQPHAGVIAGQVDFFSEGTPEKNLRSCSRLPSLKEITFISLFRENPFRSPGQIVVKRELLERIGGFKTDVWGADDYEILFRLARQTTILVTTEVVLFYRIHAHNASRFRAKLALNTLKAARSNFHLALPSERKIVAKNHYFLRFTIFLFPQLSRLKNIIYGREKKPNRLNLSRTVRMCIAYAIRNPLIVWQYIRIFIPARRLKHFRSWPSETTKV